MFDFLSSRFDRIGGSPLANPGGVQPSMFSGRKTKQDAREQDELAAEIKRVEALVADLSGKLKNPDLELSAMMRLTISQNELLAYLRGIRYALGEEESSCKLKEVKSKAG